MKGIMATSVNNEMQQDHAAALDFVQHILGLQEAARIPIPDSGRSAGATVLKVRVRKTCLGNCSAYRSKVGITSSSAKDVFGG